MAGRCGGGPGPQPVGAASRRALLAVCMAASLRGGRARQEPAPTMRRGGGRPRAAGHCLTLGPKAHLGPEGRVGFAGPPYRTWPSKLHELMRTKFTQRPV
jgi:hypothetical protein